jgi:predicted TIM-barrel fold metal-dependent hydrolase
MPYVDDRIVYDADSHVMELEGWLSGYADPGVRDALRPLFLEGAGAFVRETIAKAEQRRDDAAAMAALEADIMHDKGWLGLGAFDPEQRSRALDHLGFAAQLVFSTFAPTQFEGKDLELLYGGTQAHNRAMADFCAHDARLLPVAYVPWGPPDLTLQLAQEAIDLDSAAILVPSVPPRDGNSPTHPDYHPFWALLEESDVPFVLHIGGGGRLTRPAFHRNGIPVTDFLGGGENIRAKDYIGISHPPEMFLAAMVFDGILEKFPGLRGGSIEQGALWVVPWMRKLDLARRSFGRTEQVLRELPMEPSDYVRRQLRFTPFPGEPVGWMIEHGGPELFCFSSDYPHPEGTRDPVGRFEATLDGIDEDTRDRFYCRNFADLMGGRIAQVR